MKPRRRAFIKNLEITGYNVKKSAEMAGYSSIYAHKQGKRLLKGALREQAKEIMEQVTGKEITTAESKKLMHDMVGISRQSLLDNVKYLAEQEKDLGTRLKVIAPLVRELGIELGSVDEQSKVTVPILNVTVKQNSDTQDIDVTKDGSTEPPQV